MFAYINQFVSSLKIGQIFLVIALHLLLMAPSFSRAGDTTGNTDLAIGKSANTTSALVGNTVVFTIGFTNFGSTTANNLAGSDIVPDGLSIFAWNSSGSASAPVYNPTNGVWTIDAIAAGATDLLTISTTATNSGIYTNTATITSAGNTNNNAASAVVTLPPQTADLMVTKTAGLYDGPLTNQFQPGDVALFTITITNLGPGTAYNIAGSDVLEPLVVQHETLDDELPQRFRGPDTELGGLVAVHPVAHGDDGIQVVVFRPVFFPVAGSMFQNGTS